MNYDGLAEKGYASANLQPTTVGFDLKQSIQLQLSKAQSEVVRLQELQTLLNNNPDVQRILELMQKGY